MANELEGWDLSGFEDVGGQEIPSPAPVTPAPVPTAASSDLEGWDLSGFEDLGAEPVGTTSTKGEDSFWKGFAGTATKQNPEMVRDAFEAFSHLVDENDEPIPGLKGSLSEISRQFDNLSKLSPDSVQRDFPSWNEVHGVGDAIDWVQETMGSGIASSLPQLTGAIGGTAIGKRLLPGMGKLGGTAGFAVGLGSSSMIMSMGDAYSSIKGEGIDPKRAAQLSLYVAPIMASLDAIPVGQVAARLGGVREAKREFARSLVRRVAEEGLDVANKEAVTEIAQTMLPQYAVALEKDEPFWTRENIAEQVESGVAGWFGGGPLGAVGGLKGDAVVSDGDGDGGGNVSDDTLPPVEVVQDDASNGSRVDGTTTAAPPPTGSADVKPDATHAKKKGKKRKKTGAIPTPEGDIGFSGESVDSDITFSGQAVTPEVAAALTPTQAAKPALDTAEDIAARVETAAVQPVTQEVTPEPTVAPTPQAIPTPQAANENVPPQAGAEPTPEPALPGDSPRVLRDESAGFVEPQVNREDVRRNLSEATPRKSRGKNWTPAEREARAANQNLANNTIAAFMPNMEAEQFYAARPNRDDRVGPARDAIMQRARGMVEAFEAEGGTINKTIRRAKDESMEVNDAQLLLSEAKWLVTRKNPSKKDFDRFMEREISVRTGGDVKAERRTESDIANRRSQGEVETRSGEQTAWTEEEAAKIEAAAEAAGFVSTETTDTETNLAPEDQTVTVTNKKTGSKKEATASLDQLEETPAVSAQAADMEDVQPSVPTSKRGAPKLFDEETASKVTSGDKLSPAEKAKMIAERNAQLAAEQAPKGAGPKAAEVVKKAKGAKREAPTSSTATQAQLEAGNYVKPQRKIHGLTARIENRKGSIRSGVDRGGKEWSVRMPASYGYIERTEGKDGDQVDVYIGPKPTDTNVYVVDQLDLATGKFDEHKVLMGFENARQAFETYIAGFSDGKGQQRIGEITPMTVDEFKAWLKNGDQKKPAVEAKSEGLTEVTQVSKPAPKPARKSAAEQEAEAAKWLEENEGSLDDIGRLDPEDVLAADARNADLEALLNEQSTSVEPRRPGETFMAYVERTSTSRMPLKEMLKRTGQATNYLTQLGMTDPAYRPIFNVLSKRIERMSGDVPVYILPDATLQALMNAPNPAAYYAEIDVILVNETTAGSPRLPYTVLHEGMHAAFVNATSNMPEVRRLVDRIAREAKAAGIVDQYAFTNIDEFIAEAFSNTAFMRQLANTKSSAGLAVGLAQNRASIIGAKLRTLWDSFLDAVTMAFGMDGRLSYSLLDAMVHVGSELERGATDENFRGRISKGVVRARAADRTALEAKPGSPWTYGKNDSGIYPAPLERAEFEMSARGNAAKAWFQRNYVKFQTWSQMSRTYASTKFGPMLREISDALNGIQPLLDQYRKEYGEMAHDLAEFVRTNPKQAAEMIDVMLTATNLEVSLVDGVAPDQIASHKSNTHLGKEKKIYTQARHHLPELQRRYNAMKPETRALFQKTTEFYRKKHNELVTEMVTNIINEGKQGTIPQADRAGLIQRTLDGTLTDADKQLLGKTLYNHLSKEAEFRKQKGTYAPRMRYGDFVVEMRDTIKDTMGGTLTDDDTVVFRDTTDGRAWKQAKAFLQKTPFNQLRVEHFYVDANTGKRVTADQATGLNDVDHEYEVQVQTRAVYFFESMYEAQKFHKDNPEGHEITTTPPQSRIGSGYHAHTLSGTQVETLLSAINVRDDLKTGQKELFRTMVSQASARMVRGNRIESRRLRSRKITGASKDFARNLMNYGEAAANHIAYAKAFPKIRSAVSEMKKITKGYEGSDKPLLVDVENEVDARLQNANLEAQAPAQWMQDLLTLSFLTRLFSPAYSLINGLQVTLVTAPVLGGRFGNARAGVEIANAYDAMGFGGALGSGIKNTAKATAQWSKSGLSSMDDVYTTMREKLAKQRDGKALLAMLDQMVERGAISSMAGFETSEANARGRGAWGHTLSKVDRIARQLPLAIEIINRGVTGVAAYRLAVKSGMNTQKATDFAIDTVDRTQGIYSNINAPRFFNNPYLRPWAQFKKYAQFYTQLMVDMAYKSFKDADVKERRIAQKQLANVMAMQVLMAGSLGLPGLELVKLGFLISSSLGLSGGWEEQEEWLQQLAEDALGKDWGEMLTRGVIPRALGLDISSRVGAADMWLFGEPRNPDDPHKIKSWLWDTAGGSVGVMALDMWGALKKVAQGDFMKAAEDIPIKTFGDAIKSLNRGEDWGTVAVNTFGLRTAAQTEGFRGVGKALRRRDKFSGDYSTLFQEYIHSRSPAARAKAIAKIRTHNRAAPHRYRISLKQAERIRRREAHQP